MQKLSTLHFNPSGCAGARFWKLFSLIHGFSFSRNKFTSSQNQSVRGGDDLFCLTATRGTNDSIKMEFLSVSFHIFNLVLRSSCVCLVNVEQVTLCSNTVRTYRLALVVDVEGVGEEIKTLPINARSEKKQMFGVFFFLRFAAKYLIHKISACQFIISFLFSMPLKVFDRLVLSVWKMHLKEIKWE